MPTGSPCTPWRTGRSGRILPLKWTFNLAGGYDDNVNASNYDQQEAAFIKHGHRRLPGQLRFRDPVLLLRQAWGYLLPEGP
ncbi:MAG: hypothetical protein ACLT8E_03195 [Akkermansia sp.]